MITSAKSERIKYIIRLQQKARFRKAEGLFVCEGVRLVTEAPLSLVSEVYLLEGIKASERLERWLTEARGHGIRVEEVAAAAYQRMTEVMHPQGVLALVRMPKARSGESSGDPFVFWEHSSSLQQRRKELLVFLEDLQDPGNLGTIMRTAEAAGATGVIASGGCVDFYSPKVVRSTMGSIFRLPHEVNEGFLTRIAMAKERGIRVYGAALKEGSVPYEEVDFSKDCAILIGNEGNGLSEEALAECDGKIIIPMQGEVESLNAGMAAGVLLFEAARQRRARTT